MQVYKGMDIGTAKASLVERQSVPHHLIDILDLRETFSAADFVRLANHALQEIIARGRQPIFCGGTGLYLKAWLHGLGEAPAANPEIRAQLEKEPLDMLLQELEQADPVCYSSIDRRNARRVVRALEVIRITGQPFSSQKSNWKDIELGQNKAFCFGISREKEELAQRIHLRVDRMFESGLVEETKNLLNRGLLQNPAAVSALGYRQVIDYLDGRISLMEAIDLTKIKTRQFAKRQLTWFRHQMNICWLEGKLDRTTDRETAFAQIQSRLE